MKTMDLEPALVSERNGRAVEILRLNDRGGYTIPTAGLYPYQWNWDSAITALGWAQIDVARAWREFETLMAGQWADGMVPHILFHSEDPGYFPSSDVWQGTGPIPSSGITQPAVAASMARKVYEADPEAGRAPMRRLFQPLRAWHRWFMAWRQDDHGAICTTHPWESGRDNAPEWDRQFKAMSAEGVGNYVRRDTSHVDASMRPTKFDYDRYLWLVQLGARLKWDQAALLRESPFRMADPTMTFLLLRAQRDLIWLGQAIGADTTGMAEELALMEAGAESLWNDEISSYDCRDAHDGEFAGQVSNAAYLCWWAGMGRPAQAERLAQVMAQVRYPVPSHPPDGDHFDSRRYWRGPTWAFMNMMIGMGLEDAGETELATRLRRSTAELIAEHGFAEYFDPLDGTPAGGRAFSWTAAVWLGWASPSAAKEG